VPRAAIGIGSNLGDRAGRIGAAFAGLAKLGAVLARSSLYRAAPWGRRTQPEFLNAAALIETRLGPHALLAALQALEAELGRRPGERWGPRAVDLDLLTYGQDLIVGERLVVPHPRMLERAFVLAPLAEIDPSYAAALRALPSRERADVRRLESGTEAARVEAEASMSEPSVAGGLGAVRELVEAFSASGLVSLAVRRPAFAVNVRRAARSPVASAPPGRNGRASAAVEVESPADAAAIESGADVLVADLVGIVRLSRPAPRVGEELDGDRELAYVEALGIRNPIRSHGAGTVVKIFVADGAAVDYGAPLFAIERV
jgi:2-amino-4-hydroxy-6-hydroxymethyldihydropteridine diphosphokinase